MTQVLLNDVSAKKNCLLCLLTSADSFAVFIVNLHFTFFEYRSWNCQLFMATSCWCHNAT